MRMWCFLIYYATIHCLYSLIIIVKKRFYGKSLLCWLGVGIFIPSVMHFIWSCSQQYELPNVQITRFVLPHMSCGSTPGSRGRIWMTRFVTSLTLNPLISEMLTGHIEQTDFKMRKKEIYFSVQALWNVRPSSRTIHTTDSTYHKTSAVQQHSLPHKSV